jgi:hypothetical protein
MTIDTVKCRAIITSMRWHMNAFKLMLCTLAVLVGPAISARAGTVTTFDVASSSASGNLTGNLTVDVGSGSFIAADIAFPGLPDFNTPSLFSPGGPDVGAFFVFAEVGGVDLYLLALGVNVDTLVGFTGSAIPFWEIIQLANCDGNCLDIRGAGGSVSATPLPAALPLFASGGMLLGLLRWRRRRKLSA